MLYPVDEIWMRIAFNVLEYYQLLLIRFSFFEFVSLDGVQWVLLRMLVYCCLSALSDGNLTIDYCKITRSERLG